MSNTIRYSNGDVYRGSTKYGKKHGYGTMTYTSGDVYKGDWVDGNKHGKGILTTSEGEIFDCEWENDIKRGHCAHIYTDGTKVTGKYLGDIIKTGTIKYTNGDIYKGEIQDDIEKHGNGELTYANGITYKGVWNMNVRYGEGTIIYPNGTKLAVKCGNYNECFSVQQDIENRHRKYSLEYTVPHVDMVRQYERVKFVRDCPVELLPVEGKCPDNFPEKYTFNAVECCRKSMKKEKKESKVSDTFIRQNHGNLETLYTDVQKNIILLYTFNGDVLLRSFMLNGFKPSLWFYDYFRDKSDTFYKATFTGIDPVKYVKYIFTTLQTCFKTIKYDKNIVVYRGISDFNETDYRTGSMIKNTIFWSTTANLAVALNFATTKNAVVFRILIPINTYICPIFELSQYPYEEEILLNYGSTFYVTKSKYNTTVPDSNGKTYAFIDLVLLHTQIIDIEFPDVDINSIQ